MNRYLFIFIVLLLGIVPIVQGADFAIYSGPTNPDWISNDAVKKM